MSFPTVSKTYLIIVRKLIHTCASPGQVDTFGLLFFVGYVVQQLCALPPQAPSRRRARPRMIFDHARLEQRVAPSLVQVEPHVPEYRVSKFVWNVFKTNHLTSPIQFSKHTFRTSVRIRAPWKPLTRSVWAKVSVLACWIAFLRSAAL